MEIKINGINLVDPPTITCEQLKTIFTPLENPQEFQKPDGSKENMNVFGRMKYYTNIIQRTLKTTKGQKGGAPTVVLADIKQTLDNIINEYDANIITPLNTIAHVDSFISTWSGAPPTLAGNFTEYEIEDIQYNFFKQKYSNCKI